MDHPRRSEDRPGADDQVSQTERAQQAVRRFRSELTLGEDSIDTDTWAGSIPQVYGVAPRVRVGRSRWFNLLWLVPIAAVGLVVAIPAAQGLRNVPAVADFIERYPGADPAWSAGAGT
ncbi:MAG TPA: hypothetical protein P5193_06125, partial [Microthrixaceae bacterium]|nr:hypothetical protein [Microthrixaceae bacterium]